MESAFGWIGKIAEFVANLFPRLLVLETTHLGVAFVRGSYVVILYPGLHIYWPFWTTIYTLPAVRQTEKIPSQSLMTFDKKPVVVKSMVRYEIKCARKALAKTYQVDTAVHDETMGAIAAYVAEWTFKEIHESPDGATEELTQKVRERLKDYGVFVLKAQLTDLAECTTVNLVGNMQAVDSMEFEEE